MMPWLMRSVAVDHTGIMHLQVLQVQKIFYELLDSGISWVARSFADERELKKYSRPFEGENNALRMCNESLKYSNILVNEIPT